jgi:hypothetical protein
MMASLLLSACVNTPGKRGPVTDQPTSLAGGRPLVIQRSAADERALTYIWQQQGQFVRVETAEPGAEPHQHPLDITKHQIKEALQRIRVDTADGVPLLSDQAMEKIAGPLAQAMGQATADQEVSFAIADRPPGIGRFMSRRITTGRLFHETNGMNLIVGLLHTPFEDKMLATGHRIAFIPGSLQQRYQEGWSLWTNELVTHPVAGRDDWVRIDSKAWSGSVLSDETESIPQQHAPIRANQEGNHRNLEKRLEVRKKAAGQRADIRRGLPAKES